MAELRAGAAIALGRSLPLARSCMLVLATACWLLLLACQPSQPGNLLGRGTPRKAHAVARAKYLTNGVAASPVDALETTETTQFYAESAHVTYDLGQPRTIRAVWLQAEARGRFAVSTSDDGVHFQAPWVSEPDSAAQGLQPRFARNLALKGRYLRVSHALNTTPISLGELQAFSDVPAVFPPVVPVRTGVPLADHFRNKVLLLGLCAMLFLLLVHRDLSRLWVLLLTAIPAVGVWGCSEAWFVAWPVSGLEVALVRAVVAAVAAVAVAREAFAPRRWPARPSAILATLAVCGALSVLSFYNLGRGQFYDDKRQASTPVHYLDLRQYYPVAKYFDELGYTRLYEADVLAYSEDTASLDALAELPFRDLNTHDTVQVKDRRAEIAAVKRHFSPERWEAYKADARFFRETMGTNHYLGTMFDHGGNATPVWIGIAQLLFNWLSASNSSFLITGLADPLLLLILFVAIGKTFGLRPLFVSAVIFGANDFIMFGTNWGGATLRHDWLVFLGLGICALKARHFVLAGIFLGLSSMIRAFPALVIVGVGLPAVIWYVERWHERRKLPAWSELRASHPAALRTIPASVITIVVLFLVTSWSFSLAAWKEWLVKVSVLSGGVHVNAVSLRSLIEGTSWAGYPILPERSPLLAFALLFYVGLVVLACRNKPPERAAAISLILIPVIFPVANYYIHIVCLLPLLAVEPASSDERAGREAVRRETAFVWMMLLGMCTALYPAVLIGDVALHFYLESWILFAALTPILIRLVATEFQAWWRAPASAAAGRPAAASGTTPSGISERPAASSSGRLEAARQATLDET
ncbi:MAG TPA: hypothetical protein VI072_20885 [Polyangiaceae bacterium]